MKREPIRPWLIIGIIDAYGTIHHRAIDRENNQSQFHETYWPNAHHKRWRFILSEWDVEKSVLSKDTITHEECLEIEAHIRKYYNPPLWVIEGEEWEALGRPRSGPAYEKHCRKWDRIKRLQNKKKS